MKDYRWRPIEDLPVSLQDDESQATQRLDKWLDDVLLVGLDLWRKQL
jgi:hypothetical protein